MISCLSRFPCFPFIGDIVLEPLGLDFVPFGPALWTGLIYFERKELSVRWSRPIGRPPLGGEGYQRDGASSRFTHLVIFIKIQSQVRRKLVAELKICQRHSFGRSPLCIN
ncbi:hypothetical protein MTR_3g019990 [Medicago truncatula]|uniref:Uncharacterized protein n=1 Tax=Medicago truncatula TaxID=3880 RepID=G7IZ06_MEDTR|nr:hypothetical protein MTR_3g019990 [Medicago truncatula]